MQPKRPLREFFLMGLLVWLMLSGCEQGVQRNRVSTQMVQATLTSTPAVPPLFRETPSLQFEPTRPQEVWTLKVWLPPQFAPNESQAGAILQERLRTFDERHPEVQIEVRLKALEGPGGLLESLATASVVAPLALPDLVAMPRPLLETAALKGLVYPLDDMTSGMNSSDWFGYAHSLSVLQSSIFGLPFAGDALLIVYRPEQEVVLTAGWEALLTEGNILAFPASDPQALFTLLLYQAVGGKVIDEQGRPFLDETLLVQVLAFFQRAAQAGVMPFWLSQYESFAQTWMGFQDRQATMVVSWASTFFQQRAIYGEALMAGLVPVPEGAPSFTLAEGWVWASASPQPERRKMSMQVAEYLLNKEFLAQWTQVAGLIPVSREVLQLWSDASARQLAGQLAVSAVLYPSADILSSLGPALRQATLDVIKQEKSPDIAARDALNSLQNP